MEKREISTIKNNLPENFPDINSFCLLFFRQNSVSKHSLIVNFHFINFVSPKSFFSLHTFSSRKKNSKCMGCISSQHYIDEYYQSHPKIVFSQEFCNSMNNGDIILFEGDALSSQFIEIETKSPWS